MRVRTFLTSNVDPVFEVLVTNNYIVTLPFKHLLVALPHVTG